MYHSIGANKVEIHRAQNLGPLAQKLNIKPTARISYRTTQSGVVIWDLTTGNKYTITHGNPDAAVSSFQIPPRVKQIIDATDDELKKRYSEVLSQKLAPEVAGGLRSIGFDGVKPVPGGPGKRAFQGGLGPKKVDVSYDDVINIENDED